MFVAANRHRCSNSARRAAAPIAASLALLAMGAPAHAQTMETLSIPNSANRTLMQNGADGGGTGPGRSSPKPERDDKATGAGTWMRMKMLYTDNPPTADADVVAAYNKTDPEWYRNAKGVASIVYQKYDISGFRVILMVAQSPKCRVDFIVPPGSKITACPFYAYLTPKDGQPEMIMRRGCYQWNGQSPAGSATDARLNSNYTLYDPRKNMIKVYAVKNGQPQPGCTVELAFDDDNGRN